MITINPRYQETDQMGIVHHSSYYAWFELARDALFASLNRPYILFEERGVHMKVLETKCHYLRSAKYGRPVNIKSELISCNGVRTVIKYIVHDEAILLTKAEITYVFTDFSGKLINMKKKHPELVKEMI